ncbi:hypothetical protein PG988_004771 [Apiospora saccharicola]
MPVLVVRVRPNVFPFLQLPREIRDVIYKFVLVEPPKYQRRHEATCKYASLSPTCAEKPPFCTAESYYCEDFCHCAKRRNLAILSVNRQIYDEGSPVLWEDNVFSFCSTASFNQWLESTVSAAKRSIIRHIAIYLIQHWAHRLGGDDRGIAMDDRLLYNLQTCTNLRRLDLGPSNSRHEPGPACMPDGFAMTLCRLLPHLKSLRMAGFTLLAYLPSARRDSGGSDGAADRTRIWGLVHVDIRIDDLHAEEIPPLDIDLRTHGTLWHTRADAVGRQLESPRDGQWGGYCDTRSTVELQLPHEAHPIEVNLVGVPNSPATCARFQLKCEEAERLRQKREAREEELRRGEALRLAREADRRQEADSHEAARVRESEASEKQLKEEETRQKTQLDRHIRNHLATRKAERKRSRRTK